MRAFSLAGNGGEPESKNFTLSQKTSGTNVSISTIDKHKTKNLVIGVRRLKIPQVDILKTHNLKNNVYNYFEFPRDLFVVLNT